MLLAGAGSAHISQPFTDITADTVNNITTDACVKSSRPRPHEPAAAHMLQGMSSDLAQSCLDLTIGKCAHALLAKDITQFVVCYIRYPDSHDLHRALEIQNEESRQLVVSSLKTMRDMYHSAKAALTDCITRDDRTPTKASMPFLDSCDFSPFTSPSLMSPKCRRQLLGTPHSPSTPMQVRFAQNGVVGISSCAIPRNQATTPKLSSVVRILARSELNRLEEELRASKATVDHLDAELTSQAQKYQNSKERLRE